MEEENVSMGSEDACSPFNIIDAIIFYAKTQGIILSKKEARKIANRGNFVKIQQHLRDMAQKNGQRREGPVDGDVVDGDAVDGDAVDGDDRKVNPLLTPVNKEKKAGRQGSSDHSSHSNQSSKRRLGHAHGQPKGSEADNKYQTPTRSNSNSNSNSRLNSGHGSYSSHRRINNISSRGLNAAKGLSIEEQKKRAAEQQKELDEIRGNMATSKLKYGSGKKKKDATRELQRAAKDKEAEKLKAAKEKQEADDHAIAIEMQQDQYNGFVGYNNNSINNNNGSNNGNFNESNNGNNYQHRDYKEHSSNSNSNNSENVEKNKQSKNNFRNYFK